MSVYDESTHGEVYRDARLDTVSSLQAFRDTLTNAATIPNITDAYDSHLVSGAIMPYATVGILKAQFENVGAGSSTYDMVVRMDVQVFLHFSALVEIYDERERWDLLNSLFNYYKNTIRISSNFDGLFIQSMEGDVQFPATQTSGSVFNFQLWKVVAT